MARLRASKRQKARRNEKLKGNYCSLILRSLRAFVITQTEDKLMAAAANIGESIIPKNEYRIPAAIRTPAAL